MKDFMVRWTFGPHDVAKFKLVKAADGQAAFAEVQKVMGPKAMFLDAKVWEGKW